MEVKVKENYTTKRRRMPRGTEGGGRERNKNLPKDE